MFVATRTFRVKRGPKQEVVWIKLGDKVPEAARWSRPRRSQFVKWDSKDPMPKAPRGSSGRGAYRTKGEESPTPEKKSPEELEAELEAGAGDKTCSAKTQAGSSCTRKVSEGSAYCPQHSSQKTG